MGAIKKLLGMYLILVATVVAVWFIITSLFVDSFSVNDVWYVLDILMVIGLAIGLAYNFDRKRKMDSQTGDSGISRRYLEINVAFYLSAAVTILFLHNWFALLGLGSDNLGGPDASGNHQRWIIWAVVDTMLPIVLGVTGCHMWADSASSESDS